MFEDVQSFRFLGLTVYTYGLLVSLGAALWIVLSLLLAKKKKLPGDAVLLAAALAIPLGLVFGRLVFCLVNLGYFLEQIGQPAAMLYFWDGGFSMMGALMGVSLAAVIAAKVKRVRLGSMMDLMAVSAGAFIAMARLGEIYTALGRGRSIEAEWMRQSPFFGIQETWSDDVFQAVFRYEAAAAVLLLVVMVVLFLGKKAEAAKPGDLALVFITLFGSAQVVLESLRDDRHMLLGFVRASQIISILLPVAAIAVFSIRVIRREGMRGWVIAAWLVAAAAIVLAVVKEFAVDTSDSLTREYLMMSFAMAVLAAVALLLWKRAKRNQLQA